MMSVAQCADLNALASGELILGVSPSERHRKLLAGYLLSGWRGPAAVRNMIVFDLRYFLDLGVPSRAADLLIVLRLFLSETGHVSAQFLVDNHGSRPRRRARIVQCPLPNARPRLDRRAMQPVGR